MTKDTSAAAFSRRSLVDFAPLALQLLLALWVVDAFQIESPAFLRMFIAAVAGFAVHYFTPARLRLPLFLALSLGTIWLVFGSFHGLWLVGIGLVLIGLCHLPVRFWVRVILLLVAGATLAALRTEWLPSAVPLAVWPILASMFMFRLIVYVYDLRHETEPVSVWHRLSYFFLLPNVCFPLFPVIDFRTFRERYYDDRAVAIHQVGVRWIVRGLLHLLLYRLVYYNLTVDPVQIASGRDLAQFMISSLLLYLRVSGQFHLIVGILRLYGFNLPETNHLYFLASSFTEYWRRINIYWKDFMTKVVYLPSYVALDGRGLGKNAALALSTIAVFLVSWQLHSYQWFWLQGVYPIRGTDAVFWGSVGLLVLYTSLREINRRQRRFISERRRSMREAAIRALRTAAVFSIICVLWSLWMSESLVDWLSLWRQAARGGITGLVWLPAFGLIVGACHLVSLVGSRSPKGDAAAGADASILRSAAVNLSILLVLLGLCLPAVPSALGARGADIVASLRESRLNRQDLQLLQKGYYESLMSVQSLNSQLWEVYMQRPMEWVPLRDTEAIHWTRDFLGHELEPGVAIFLKGTELRTNRWGMRDDDYALEPPPGTYRVALLGASIVMASGVQQAEGFEARLEERLNRAGDGNGRIEILNFAVGGYSPLQRLRSLEVKALGFSPHAVVYVLHGSDEVLAVRYLAKSLVEGIEIPYPTLVDLLEEAGAERSMPAREIEALLRPHGGRILDWLVERLAGLCREHGSTPVVVYLPGVGERVRPAWIERRLRAGRNAGLVVTSLANVYEGHDFETIRLADWDFHPNAAGHRLIADQLYEELFASGALAESGVPVR